MPAIQVEKTFICTDVRDLWHCTDNEIQALLSVSAQTHNEKLIKSTICNNGCVRNWYNKNMEHYSPTNVSARNISALNHIKYISIEKCLIFVLMRLFFFLCMQSDLFEFITSIFDWSCFVSVYLCCICYC